jgi:D-alanine transaminase
MNNDDKSKVNGLVWLNGRLTDFASGEISVEDRAFVFGDGVYEVIRVYAGKPFALDRHLARLERSADGIELNLPMPASEFAALATDLVAKSGLGSAEIYIQVSRGASRRNHIFPDNVEPTCMVGVRSGREIPAELWVTGCSVITVPDQRWARCDLKTICLLPNVLAKEAAHKAGALEAVMIRGSVVTEATSSNVFIWKSGALVTPVSDNRILPGITRAITIELARSLGYPVVERDVEPSELFSADEMFLTGTTMELMPVVKIDRKPVGIGAPGEVRADLHSAFRELTIGQQ